MRRIGWTGRASRIMDQEVAAGMGPALVVKVVGRSPGDAGPDQGCKVSCFHSRWAHERFRHSSSSS